MPISREAIERVIDNIKQLGIATEGEYLIKKYALNQLNELLNKEGQSK